MVSIRLQLLGGFTVESLDGALPVALPRKSRGLLTYLALTHPDAQPRHRLATLLWPDVSDTLSRTNLRQALSTIRREVGDILDADKESVGLRDGAVHTDIGEFEALARSSSTEDLERALALYRGHLLDGFQSDTPAFDQWLSTERERLHQSVMVSGTRALAGREAAGQIEGAVLLANRMVALDPLREDAHRALMRLYARQGRSAQAMRQYRSLRELLARELGVSPEPETENLHQEIAGSRQGRVGDDASVNEEVLRSVLSPRPDRPGQGEGPDVRTEAVGPIPNGIAPPGAERRQLTVMSCEIVGLGELSTRLDPEDLQPVARSLEDVITACVARYEGVVRQRQGDSVVAFFGYPRAHEDEAQRAIRAGLDIVEAVGGMTSPEATDPLRARIGIATGLVVMSTPDEGVSGGAVSVAERLRGLARPDSIVVSERVRGLAGGAFEFRDLGEQSGAETPERACEVSGLSDAESRFEAATKGRLTPLVGREQELGLLLERWALAQDGEGEVVLLGGEAGIGKSRVLSTLRERLEAQEVQALRLQCSPYFVNRALWPSIENLERVLAFERGETESAKLDKLESLVVGHYGRPVKDVRFLAELLSIECEGRYGESGLTPQRQKEETLRTLVDLTEAAARRQPSVLLFEDVHWADPTTLETLDLLMDRVSGMPLLVVLTHRPEFESRWGKYGHVTSLNLTKLTRVQSRALIVGVLEGRTLPEELIDQIVAKTDGVPLFVEELTKSIVESGRLVLVGDRYEYEGSIEGLSLPETLRDSLMSRLDRHASAKEVAQIGAAIGREFSHELIAAVATTSPEVLEDSLVQLTEAGLVFRRGSPPGATYTFKHALIQDTAYESMLKSRRQGLHGRIAEALEETVAGIRETQPELLAHHLTAAGRHAEAIPYWQKAASNAFERVALQDTVAHSGRGLALLDAIEDAQARAKQELSFQLLTGHAVAHLKGWCAPEPGQAFMRARELCEVLGDAPEVFSALWGVWAYLDVAGRVDAADVVAREFLERAKRVGDTAAICEGERIVGEMAFRLGDLPRARRHLEEGIRIHDLEAHRGNIRLYGQDSGMTNLAYLASLYALLGYPERAMSAVRQAHELAERLQHPFTTAWVHHFRALAHCELREWDTAAEVAAQAVAICNEHGFGYFLACTRSTLDISHMAGRGRIERGDSVREQFTFIRAVGALVHFPFYCAKFADACMALGEVHEGLRFVEEGLRLAEDMNERFEEPELHRLRGELLLLSGPELRAEAEASFATSLEIARRQCAKLIELRTATSLARHWQSQGKTREALELLEPVYRWFTEGFDASDLVEARATLCDLGWPGDRGEDAPRS
ncbi:MAG: AAA family ATPase [Betaproteobacteria bacterium]|nr:AAA family ATPase [Betaproteobacteria bacterium]